MTPLGPTEIMVPEMVVWEPSATVWPATITPPPGACWIG